MLLDSVTSASITSRKSRAAGACSPCRRGGKRRHGQARFRLGLPLDVEDSAARRVDVEDAVEHLDGQRVRQQELERLRPTTIEGLSDEDQLRIGLNQDGVRRLGELRQSSHSAQAQ